MKNNGELQKDVQDAIKWEPFLNDAEIGVSVKDGIVTLSGLVDSYIKKSEAETAAQNVAGVKAVVEKIEVRFGSSSDKKEDNEIAAEILDAFKWRQEVPDNMVKIKVEDGWVTLQGELPWHFQKDAAGNAVKYLMGVKGISNNIKVKSDTEDVIEKADVEKALRRNWAIAQSEINVEVLAHTATLTGTVDSTYQKSEAGRIAGNAAGIWTVVNEIRIDYQYALMDE